MVFDPEKLSLIPEEPGVYLMIDETGSILYVGKANKLRTRLRSYFSGSDTRAMVPKLLAKIDRIETILLSSEQEALLAEQRLIRLHQPRYNACLKDDRSFSMIGYRKNDPFPRLELLRKEKREKSFQLHGPYPNGGAARVTLQLVQKLFQLRQCSPHDFAHRSRPCILHAMGHCSAPCVGLIGQEEYHERMKEASSFLSGDTGSLIDRLRREMESAAHRLEFERAGEFLRIIQSIESTLSQSTVLTKVQGEMDVIALTVRGGGRLLTLLTFEEGILLRSDRFFFGETLESDGELLGSFLLQWYERMTFINQFPKKILLPFPPEGEEELQRLLQPKKLSLLQAVTRDQKRLLKLAALNGERSLIEEAEKETAHQFLLQTLKEKLSLPCYPRRIECIDISHFAGHDPCAAIVCFVEGKKETSGYRRLAIRSVKGGDDLRAMEEVVERRIRQTQKGVELPDLLLLDGGQNHLRKILDLLERLNVINLAVVAIAKEEGRHDRGLREEKLYLHAREEPLSLEATSPLLLFLQKIRDEAHRYALSYQRKLREKKAAATFLPKIPTIGEKRRKELLRTFGSSAAIRKATRSQLESCSFLTKNNIEQILTFPWEEEAPSLTVSHTSQSDGNGHLSPKRGSGRDDAKLNQGDKTPARRQRIEIRSKRGQP